MFFVYHFFQFPIRKFFTRPLPLIAVMTITGKLLAELGLGATAQAIVEARANRSDALAFNRRELEAEREAVGQAELQH